MSAVADVILWVIYPLILLVYYFVTDSQPPAEVPPILYLANTVVVFAFLALHRFLDGWQETTRHIARIYLLRKCGLAYDNSFKTEIQILMIPNWVNMVALVCWLAQIASFPTVLFSFGWKWALGMNAAVFLSGIVPPLRHRNRLRRISRHLQMLDWETMRDAFASGIDIRELAALVDEALANKLHPGRWWAETLAHVRDQAMAERHRSGTNETEGSGRATTDHE